MYEILDMLLLWISLSYGEPLVVDLTIYHCKAWDASAKAVTWLCILGTPAHKARDPLYATGVICGQKGEDFGSRHAQ